MMSWLDEGVTSKWTAGLIAVAVVVVVGVTLVASMAATGWIGGAFGDLAQNARGVAPPQSPDSNLALIGYGVAVWCALTIGRSLDRIARAIEEANRIKRGTS